VYESDLPRESPGNSSATPAREQANTRIVIRAADPFARKRSRLRMRSPITFSIAAIFVGRTLVDDALYRSDLSIGARLSELVSCRFIDAVHLLEPIASNQ